MRLLIDIDDDLYKETRESGLNGYCSCKQIEKLMTSVYNGIVITKDQCDMEYNSGYCNGYYDALEDAVLRLQCMKKSNYDSYANYYNESPFNSRKENK